MRTIGTSLLLLALGCIDAKAAATGYTTQEARTAAPSNSVNLAGVAAAEGSALSFLRSDARFAIVGPTCAGGQHYTSTDGTHVTCTADIGSTFGTPVASPNAGNTNAAGAAGTSARSDHVHQCTAASSTQVGCVSTAAQTFGGSKTVTGFLSSSSNTANVYLELNQSDTNGRVWRIGSGTSGTYGSSGITDGELFWYDANRNAVEMVLDSPGTSRYGILSLESLAFKTGGISPVTKWTLGKSGADDSFFAKDNTFNFNFITEVGGTLTLTSASAAGPSAGGGSPAIYSAGNGASNVSGPAGGGGAVYLQGGGGGSCSGACDGSDGPGGDVYVQGGNHGSSSGLSHENGRVFIKTGATNQITVDELGTALVTINGTAALTDSVNKGRVTLIAGTGTHAVLSGAICTCSDTSSPVSVKCLVSGTTLSITGTGTDVIAYICL